MDLDQLEQVCGGGLFSTYSDDQYEAAGVEIDGPGWLYNSGYLLNGKEIDRYDADMLAFYFIYQGKRAPSIEEARRYFDVKTDEFRSNCDP